MKMKSWGRDLDAAYQQALGYLPRLLQAQLPGFVLVSDFRRLRSYDLDQGLRHDFALAELPKRLALFGFLTSYRAARPPRPKDPANAQAAELVAQLHEWPAPAKRSSALHKDDTLTNAGSFRKAKKIIIDDYFCECLV